MKRKSLLIMLLVALFVPLAMNAQDMALRKKSRVITPETKVRSLNRAISSLNVQNGPVQTSNLQTRNLNTMASSNATSGRGTRATQYELVTSELTDWSGNYILGVDAGSNVYAFNGTVYNSQSAYGSNIAGMTSVAQSSGTISDAGSAAILTVAPITSGTYAGYYTIQINGGNYLGSNSTQGFVINSSANSTDYYWYFYWYSGSDGEALILISEGDDWDNAYGITFYIETDSEGSYGGFCTYELSYDGSTFSYYNIGLYKENTSGGGSTDCDYELVTASQTDWSGDYVITYVNGTTANVLTGKASGGNFGDYTTATITDNTLANADVAAYNVTIEPVTYNNATYYTIKQGDNYLYLNTNGNYLYFGTTIPTNNNQRRYYWTIAYSGSTLTITNYASTVTNNWSTRRLLWNNQNGSQRFACYTGTSTNVKNISLFKKLTDCSSACAAPTDLAADNITNNSAELSWTGETDTYNIQYHVVDPDAPATLILNVPTDIWGDGTGYQLVLDADHNTYGSTIPTSASFTAGSFAEFEYTIPENAECSLTTNTIVVNGSASITIPAGVYDYALLNPDGSSTYWIASSNGNFPGRGDDYEFEAGKTYELRVYQSGTNDAVDLTISADWTLVEGVTNPYTLEDLDMNTQYEVQVQGVDCDGNGNTSDWSESAFFTTLYGVYVTSISADNVTVLVGETATITPTVLPEDATNPAVTYTSNGETIATVDADGVVTGVAVGTTTITIAATDGSNVSTTINVTVNGIDVTGITAENVTVVNGETATITYTVAPNNATNQSVTFTSANTAIATVDADGVVTGVSVGETTITITSVSNPEVTAEITVTVTSNPNAVQFTVTAPANAQPGDVITVEAVMTAPTSGNYDGFNALLTGIYFDNTAFELVSGSITNGAVAQQAQQMGAMILAGYDVPGVAQLTIASWNSTVTAEGVVFSAQFTVLEETEGSFEFYAKPVRDAEFTLEGVFIPYEYTPSTVTIAALETYTKTIGAYGTHGYYLIASPIGEVNPEDVTNMIDNTQGADGKYPYDLFRFDQSEDLEWQNYRYDNFQHTFNLNAGQGYLYANSNDVDLVFTGTAYSGNGQVTLSKTDNTDVDFQGWNLVGNPFPVVAYITKPYYKMNANGTKIIAVTGSSVEAMEGIFVVAGTDGETMTFSTEPSKKGSNLALNLTEDGSLIDRAIVSFSESEQLPKFQLNRNSTKLYIPQDGKDYAVVCSEEMGAMPVNFKAEDNGTYTLNFNSENVGFAYLHLIDNKTGNDIDLLQTPSYSFEAKTTDYESRFKLVFATGDNSNDDNFAFFSNGSFVINNDGAAELQVIDLMGRILSSETINGCTNVNVNAAPGVYMLRLINGDNVKVQKVVVK